MIPLFELFPQEAYYFMYAQHPALSYFDHPPMVAVFISIMTTILGKSVFGLRFGALLVTFISQVLFYKTARLLYDKKISQRITLVMASSLLISNISLIFTPDVPLLLTWTGVLYALIQAIFKEKKYFWIIAGVFMGLAFDSKYTGAATQMGLVAFLILSKNHRKLLLTPYPYLALLTAHLVMLPVYIWNGQNDWVSFAFQSTTHTGPSSLKFKPQFLVALVATQTALVGLPLLILLFKWTGTTIQKMATRIKKPLTFFSALSDSELFLTLFFIPLFLGFFMLSFTTLVKPNWITPAYLAGMLLVAPLLSKKFMKWQFIFVGVLHIVAVIYLVTMFYPIKSDDTCIGWKDLGHYVEQYATHTPEIFIFSTDGYKTSAELRFYTNISVYSKEIIGKPALQFDYIGTNINSLIGKDALYIDSSPRNLSPQKRETINSDVSGKFDSTVQLNPIIIENKFGIQRVFHIYHCYNYLGIN